MSRSRPSRIDTPEPGQESVWDYPRPPRVETAERPVRVLFAGVKIAESDRALRVLETAGPPVYYIPPEDVRTDALEPSGRRTLCEWKGEAAYWTVRVGERVARDAAWSYPDPAPGCERIRDHIAFYAQKMDECYVGEERVTPQPGRFYGGWITSDIVGPYKGAPGTENW